MNTHQALNGAALSEFVTERVSREMVMYLAQQTAQIIEFETHPTNTISQRDQPTPPSTLPRDLPHQMPTLPSIEAFIASLVTQSLVQVPTLMSSLFTLAVYVAVSPGLPRACVGLSTESSLPL
jgi:hypothetical protein